MLYKLVQKNYTHSQEALISRFGHYKNLPMRIILEEVEGSFYMDIILSEEENKDLIDGKLAEGITLMKSRRFYVGVRIGDKWPYVENFNHEGRLCP